MNIKYPSYTLWYILFTYSKNCNSISIFLLKITVFGQSSGGTRIIDFLASQLSNGLFHHAWMMSALSVFNKTLDEKPKDNLVFLNNTGCSYINCLLNVPADDSIHAVPWNVYPSWVRWTYRSVTTLMGHFVLLMVS